MGMTVVGAGVLGIVITIYYIKIKYNNSFWLWRQFHSACARGRRHIHEGS